MMHGTDSAARGGGWLPLAIVLASMVPVIAACALLPEEALKTLVSEAGSLEIGTSLVYVVLLGVVLVQGTRGGLGLIPALLAALMLARELDLHRRFSTKGISSIGFYTDAAIPLGVRIAVALVLAAIAAAVLAFVVRIAPQLIAALRRRSVFLYPLAAAAFLIGAALALDGLPRKLNTVFSVTLSAPWILDLAVLEEAVELLIPAMLLLAVWQGRPHRSRVGDPQPAARR